MHSAVLCCATPRLNYRFSRIVAGESLLKNYLDAKKEMTPFPLTFALVKFRSSFVLRSRNCS